MPRVKLPEDVVRSEKLMIVMTKAEMDELKKRAERLGIKPSALAYGLVTTAE